MKDLPRCPFHAGDCFAFDRPTQKCTALENTDFNLAKGCPFYKEAKKRKAELEEAKRRKKEIEK